MKIAFFCDSYIPTKNGVATSAHTTAMELRARGHRVMVFAPRFLDFDDNDPDVIRFVAGHWNKSDYPIAWPVLSRVAPRTAVRFRREKFDVVHVHSPFILGGLGAHWAVFNFVPLVWTFHTLYHHYAHYSITSPQSSRFYILWRVRTMLTKCDRVIAPSMAIERIIHKLRPKVHTAVLPTGVDLGKFCHGSRERARKELGFGPNDRVLLYVGRLAQEKNLSFLMRAIAPLLLRPPGDVPTRLLLVGGGPLGEAFRVMASRMGIADRVHLAGFAEGQRLSDLYAAGDIFTFASRTETQGLAIAEALCTGLPCVVVNGMGAPEAVTHEYNGLIVPASELRFREAVGRLLKDNQLRATMAANARSSADGFSVQRRAGELIELYEAVIEEARERNAAPFEMV